MKNLTLIKPKVYPQASARKEEKNVALIVAVVPNIGFITAIVWSFYYGFTSVDLIILLAMYSLTNLGITAGYHRLFTHRSFKTGKIIKILLAIAGSMAVQGPILFWSVTHRRHHQYSDVSEDPHSPHQYEQGIKGHLKGLWYAHIGWMFNHDPENWMRYVPELVKDKLVFQINLWYFYWVLLGLLIPTLLGGLFTWTWQGAVSGFLWGGLARIFLVHHVTWSINSICHLYGSQPYETKDESRNNLICAILAFGEGWHNNHHAFPASARHGLKWWQFDMTYIFIYLLQKSGLIWDVNLPSQKILETKTKTS